MRFRGVDTATEALVFDPACGQWFIGAYDDVVALLSDPRLTNDRMHGFAARAPAAALEAVDRHARWIISPEGADYSWLRPVLHAGLRAAGSREAERAAARAAHELLDELLARERFDAVSDYALAFGGLVLADLLGVPRADAARLMGWALDFVAFFNDVEITAAGAERMARSAAALTAYAHALLGAESPRARGGLLGRAATAAVRAGQELGDEAVGNVALPFLTGQVAVAQLVANAAWLLLTHEDQRARLAAQPGLLSGAIAETLRCLPPASLAPRIALEPVDLHGRRIEPGQVVQLNLAEANRDPARFPRPDRFDIARREPGALGFGHGPHTCVAAGLGRMQATVALRALLERAPGMALDPEHDVAWSPLAGVDGPEALSVRPTGAPAARRAR